MDNLDILATLEIQVTGQINVGENRRGYQNGQFRDTGNIGHTRHRTNKRWRNPKGLPKWTI
jgi:hypothetical protein